MRLSGTWAGITAMVAIVTLTVSAPSWAAPAPEPSSVATPTIATGALPLDTHLIRSLKSKDHTAAIRKIRIKLISSPSKTIWTSTSRTVSVPMVFRITDPRHVAKRIRICTELLFEDDYWCKTQVLKNYGKPRGDFIMRKTKSGWDVTTAPYYKPTSPSVCNAREYYRPSVRRYVRVVDPRNGRNLVSAQFGWTVRCSG